MKFDRRSLERRWLATSGTYGRGRTRRGEAALSMSSVSETMKETTTTCV
jgi:hypothetical protein